MRAIGELTNLRELHLYADELGDDDARESLRYINSLIELRELCFPNIAVLTDSCLATMTSLSKLEVMQISGDAMVEGHGLRNIAAAAALSLTSLSVMHISTIAALAPLRVLQELYLYQVRLTIGPDMLPLRSFSSLRILHITPFHDFVDDDPFICDALLEFFPESGALTELTLRSVMALTDVGLQKLASHPGCQNLRTLCLDMLQASKVTNKGVQSLASLRRLQYVDISHPSITATAFGGWHELRDLIELQLYCGSLRKADVEKYVAPGVRVLH
jgi:hypothetical protein